MTLRKDIVFAFRKSFEDNCFQLIIDAYNQIIYERVIVSSFMENDISAILNKNIELNPKSIKWQIFSKTENHIFKENQKIKKGFAYKQSRIDFVFSVFGINKKHEYFIEAKNLKEKNDSGLKRRYIATGIDHFISKKYENGCLVGYLVKGDLSKTVQGVNSLLKKDKRDSEFLIEKTLSTHNNYYESKHPKIGALKHLIFDFSNN